MANEAEAIDGEFDVRAIEIEGSSKSGKLVVEEEVRIGRMNWRSRTLRWSGPAALLIFLVLLPQFTFLCLNSHVLPHDNLLSRVHI